MEELEKNLADISHSLSVLTSYSKFMNRKRLINNDKISIDFDHYFYDFTDNGWEIYFHSNEFSVSATLKSEIAKKDLKDSVEWIIDRMSEIRDRLSEENFTSKFIIYINGKAQQDIDTNDYSRPIYKYKGIGENDSYLLTYKNGKYSNKDYVFCRIDYHII